MSFSRPKLSSTSITRRSRVSTPSSCTWPRARGASGCRHKQDNENCGGEGAIRLSQRLSKTLVLQKCAHTVRGRNDERYVIDRRDSTLVFRGFQFRQCHCLLPRDMRGGGGTGASCSVVCAGLGVFLETQVECCVCVCQERAERWAALTKRKVIGTIENNALPCLAGGVRSRTHICLVAEGEVNIDRIQRQPAVPRPLFSFSHSLSLPTSTPSLKTLHVLRISPEYSYWRRSAAPICRCSLLPLFEPNPRRVTPSRPSIKFERQL